MSAGSHILPVDEDKVPVMELVERYVILYFSRFDVFVDEAS